MTVSVRWYDPQETIIVYDFDGIWTWGEFRQAFMQGNSWISEKPYLINAILDLHDSHDIPDGALMQIRTYSTVAASNWGIAVLVGDNPLAEMIFSTFMSADRALGARFRIVDTFEQALATIAAYQQGHTE